MGWIAAGVTALAMAGSASALEPMAPKSTTSGSARQVEQAEQAFAKTVAQIGVPMGFRKFAAPGAVMFLPDPMPAEPFLKTASSSGELSWRPQYIGVAASDDLAFSLGPSVYKVAGKADGGFYLTIWRRGPDGAWMFVLDHGVDMPASIYEAAPQAVTVFTLTALAKADPSQGLREVDAALDSSLSRGPSVAFEGRLDDQALVVRTNRPVASGKRKVLALLAEAPPILEAHLISAGLSGDGLLGYTYGKAQWSKGPGMQPGYYVRVWRSTAQGWRLLVDHLAER